MRFSLGAIVGVVLIATGLSLVVADKHTDTVDVVLMAVGILVLLPTTWPGM